MTNAFQKRKEVSRKTSSNPQRRRINSTSKERKRSWADLPHELLEPITKGLSFIDLVRFNAVCKSWKSITRVPRINQLPWLMAFNENSTNSYKLFDPFSKKTYPFEAKPNHIDFTQLEVCASNFGWLLLSHTNQRGFLLLFNPFTKEVKELPRLHYDFNIATFSTTPTDPGCIFFTLCDSSITHTIISTCHLKDEKWSIHKFNDQYFDLKKAVYFEGSFYCINRRGALGIFCFGEQTWRLNCGPRPVDVPNNNYETHIMKSDRDILMVLLSNSHSWIQIFKLDFSEMDWVVMTSLGDLALFLDRTSIAIPTTAMAVKNRAFWRVRIEAAFALANISSEVGKGLSKDEKAQKLALQHWLEAIDPRHRYGHNLHFYYDIWFDSKSTQPFFYWLDVGNGKRLNLERLSRIDLQCQCIKYLGPKEREAYEVIVESGKLVYRQNGMLVHTLEDSKWIFVLSTSRALYVGQKKKGVFQHSSFLSGGATTAAGRLVAWDGVLEAIWPYSGHYLPTEENFKEFISFLEEHHVALTNVKRYATDDDSNSSKIIREEAKPERVDCLSTAGISTDTDTSIATSHQEDGMGTIAANVEAPVFDLGKRLSCKWTSGVGPRIGCVRDYSAELQSQALERVNLSPKVTPSPTGRCVPIPSPRPSPNTRLSPRLAYMGLPSPRVSLTTAN